MVDLKEMCITAVYPSLTPWNGRRRCYTSSTCMSDPQLFFSIGDQPLYHVIDVRYVFQPKSRSRMDYRDRKEAAKRERDGMRRMCHANNGDTDLAGKFHKTLPHNELGPVSPSIDSTRTRSY